MSAAFLLSALIQFALALVVAWLLGAAEFGAYALALSAAVLVQTALFEWIRLAATRFHFADSPGNLAGRLTRVLAALGLLMVVLALVVAALRWERWQLLALVPLLAAMSGYADFRAALMRAEFMQKRYAAFLALRNLFAAALLPLAAGAAGRAEAVLVAFLASVMLAVILMACLPRRPEASRNPEADVVVPVLAPGLPDMLGYAAPIVATNGLYLGLFLALRALVATLGGLAGAGQFSLALDFVLKLFSTVGTTFDLLFFQLALRESREQGEAAGHARLRQNLSWLIALLVPMMIGLAFVVGRLEAFLVAPEFHGFFAGFVVALLPGVALYALIQYGLHADFQLRRQTRVLIVAAGLGSAGTLLALALTRMLPMPLSLAIGLSLMSGMMLGAVYLGKKWGVTALPNAGFWLRQIGASATLVVTLVLLSSLGTGIWPLVAMVLGGGASYALAAFVLDLAGLRGQIRRRRGLGLS